MGGYRVGNRQKGRSSYGEVCGSCKVMVGRVGKRQGRQAGRYFYSYTVYKSVKLKPNMLKKLNQEIPSEKMHGTYNIRMQW